MDFNQPKRNKVPVKVKKAPKAMPQKKQKPFQLIQGIGEVINKHDQKRWNFYKIASILHLREYPDLCKFLKITPETSQMQIAKALMQQPDFVTTYKIFKSGENFLIGRQINLPAIIIRAMRTRYGIAYQELLGQVPVSKLELDRTLRKLKDNGDIILGSYKGDKRWYPVLHKIENSAVDLWKYTLNYFYAYPTAEFVDLVRTIIKSYPKIQPPFFTMKRVIAMLWNQGKLERKDGTWVISDVDFVPDKEYLERNSESGTSAPKFLSEKNRSPETQFPEGEKIDGCHEVHCQR